MVSVSGQELRGTKHEIVIFPTLPLLADSYNLARFCLMKWKGCGSIQREKILELFP